MKKLGFAIASIFFLMMLTPSAFPLGIRIGASGNYYFVTDSVFRDAYGSGGMMAGGTVTLEIMKKLNLLVEANMFKVNGQMTISEEDISFSLTPIGVGVRYLLSDSGNFKPYAGAGADLCFYKETLPPRFGDTSGSTVGFHGEIGAYFELGQRLYIDLNVRYLLASAKSEGETFKMSGVKAGMGLGIRF
jgi:opacity protein-like surface antigen